MSNLSDLLPAGAGAKTAQFTADGSLTSGQLVAVQSDGTVTAISSSNYTDFVGITDEAIADTASGSVVVRGGVSTKLTGLTTDLVYYLQPDGTLKLPTERITGTIAKGVSLSTVLDVTNEDSFVTGLAFNSDGTKLFLSGTGNDSVYQYSLGLAFELTSASYDSVSFSVATESDNPYGVNFNTDGTKMFVVDYSDRAVYQYSLSTGFDLSTASYDSVSFSYSSEGINVAGFRFNTDGTKMFLTNNSTVYQYSLTTGFDLSTASYDSVSFSVSAQSTNLRGLAFNSDGTKMFLSVRFDEIFQYVLSTGFDLSTASYDSKMLTIDLVSELGPLVFSGNGKMYIIRSGDDVYEFLLPLVDTTVTVGKSTSATSILLGS